MGLTLQQFETEIRSMTWNIPGKGVMDLWGSEGKLVISVSRLKDTINRGIMEWAKELRIEKDTWTLDDGAGGEGTLTAGTRTYSLTDDQSVITEVYVAYDDSNGFRGYPLAFSNSRNLVEDETDDSPDQGRPERIFIWKDVFELDPIPDDTYTMRFYGYHFPDTLNSSSDIPTPLEVYHANILDRCKVEVAKAINAVDVNQMKQNFSESSMASKKFDRARHHSVQIVKSNTGFW